jgi:hypothetical protein
MWQTFVMIGFLCTSAKQVDFQEGKGVLYFICNQNFCEWMTRLETQYLNVLLVS